MDHINVTSLSDLSLWNKCLFYGKESRRWRDKFLGMLPEIERRKLYIKKGFSSVFEFAYITGGVNKEQVQRVLGLEKKFEKFNKIHNLLVTGAVSVSKLSRIAGMVSEENQNDLSDKVQLLSKGALEQYVRDEKMNIMQTCTESVPGHGMVRPVELRSKDDLELTEELLYRLHELKRKGFDINAMLMEFLDMREKEIQQKKIAIAGEMAGRREEKPLSRHVPVSVRNIVYEEQGKVCAAPACGKPSKNLHHADRYGVTQQHDPFYLVPLCSEHHEIAHAKDVQLQEIKRRKTWR